MDTGSCGVANITPDGRSYKLSMHTIIMYQKGCF